MQKIVGIFIITTFVVFSFSCRKDDITTSSSDMLSFSHDTVLFDTVFVTMGSTTKRLKLYNSSSSTIVISSISVDGGANSQFRINVDGVSGNSHSNVEIEAHDSLFIFAEVTIDPNNILSPFVATDKINFLTNGNQQIVHLVAWGQNAHYYVANQYANGIPIVYLDKGTSPGTLDSTWINDKPYVIYGGYLTLDGDDKLTIDPGVRVHIHNNSGIWIYENGNIQVNGTQTDPVTFQGTRLEYAWQDIPGQWDRIWINEGSSDNVFNYAIIKNAFIGIQAETNPFNQTPTISTNTLRLNNCEIHNNSAVGVFATNYNITDTNSVITNSGQYNLILRGGGDFRFNHTTIANYWNEGTRTTPSVFLQNYYVDAFGATQIGNIDSANFYNCIIHGDQDIEFDMDIHASGNINFLLDHCLLKTTNSVVGNNYNNILLNPSGTIFVDKALHDYHIVPGNSPANNLGLNFGLGVTTDHDGIIRNDPPDLGAYEN
jgi:hypothetical protein